MVIRSPVTSRARLVIGIDPGINGAMAIITTATNEVEVYDSPAVEMVVNRKTRTRMDPQGMTALIEPYTSPMYEVHVFLENVHAMKDQGTASMFTFGTGYGQWQGILCALHFAWTLVTPQRWKKVTMPGMGKEKDASRVRAVQLWPQLQGKLGAKNRGRADAVLIAECGRRDLRW